MPVYEYEHLYDECELCDFRFAVIQAVEEEPLEYCPSCGLEVRRVVSAVSVVSTRDFNPGRAAEKGFTTWKKSGAGEWEKVAGEGVDALVGSPEDIAAVQEERASGGVLDLDADQ
jgi:putative FmdB family regulatory protein